MTWLSHERRVVGLNHWEMVYEGVWREPRKLRDLRVSLPYTRDEIDRGLDLLIGPGGPLVRGTPMPDDLGASLHDQLYAEGMAVPTGDGRWELTEKGVALDDLLAAYADPKNKWRAVRIEPTWWSSLHARFVRSAR